MRSAYNIRRKYADDENQGGARIADTIGAVLGQYAQEQEAQRVEGNEMKLRGAREMPRRETRADRFRTGILDRFRDRPTPQPIAGRPSAIPAATTGTAARVPYSTPGVTGAPQRTAEMPAFRTPDFNPEANRAVVPMSPDTLASVLREDEVEIEGAGGRRFALDPYAATKRQTAMQIAEDRRKNEEWDRRQAVEHRSNLERDRVRPRAESLTFEQRQQLERDKVQGRLEVQRLVNAGRMNDARQLRDQLAVLGIMVDIAGLEIRGAGEAVERAEAARPKGVEALTADSATKAQAESGVAAAGRAYDSTVDAASGRVRGLAEQLLTPQGDSPSTRRAPAPKFTRAQTAAEDARLKAQGLNAAQRREKLKAAGHNVQ